MRFSSLKGQSQAIESLKGYLRSHDMPASFLFTGPDSVGKSLCARVFAQAINCVTQGEDCCQECPSCLKIEKRQHPDVVFIEPDEKLAIKIEEVRQLKRSIFLKPYEARKKVFILNDAHCLTPQAQNALLKILEEPPQDSLIILVSSRPQFLFKTVLSRCRLIRFYPLKRDELKRILREDYLLDEARAHYLAYFHDGRIGEALQFKDDPHILKRKNDVIDGLTAGKSGYKLEDWYLKDRQGFRQALNILASWFADICLCGAGWPAEEFVNADRREQIKDCGSRYSPQELRQAVSSISNAIMLLEKNINLRLLTSNLRAELWCHIALSTK